MTTEYEHGQHTALRGMRRILGIDPSGDDHPDWYAGYDSVPVGLRSTAPFLGPIHQPLLDRLPQRPAVSELALIASETTVRDGGRWPLNPVTLVPICDRCEADATRVAYSSPASPVFFCEQCNEHDRATWTNT